MKKDLVSTLSTKLCTVKVLSYITRLILLETFVVSWYTSNITNIKTQTPPPLDPRLHIRQSVSTTSTCVCGPPGHGVETTNAQKQKLWTPLILLRQRHQ